MSVLSYLGSVNSLTHVGNARQRSQHSKCVLRAAAAEDVEEKKNKRRMVSIAYYYDFVGKKERGWRDGSACDRDDNDDDDDDDV